MEVDERPLSIILNKNNEQSQEGKSTSSGLGELIIMMMAMKVEHA